MKDAGLSGVVATNTTIARPPLRARATEVIRYLHRHSGGTLPIIGTGGIVTPEDAQEKLDAGASLVQLYTGFIYEGPGVVERMCRQLVRQVRAK